MEKTRAFLKRYPSFECPLSGALMRDPVTAPNGATYERSEVMRRLDFFGYKVEDFKTNVFVARLFASLWKNFELETVSYDRETLRLRNERFY